MPTELLRTEKLCRYYRRGTGTVKAIDGVDLAIQPSEFLAVVGSSGSGKSTLLNLLAGLDSATSGRVVVDGVDLSSLPARGMADYRARTVGMVFQSFNLLPHHTALKNVELALYFDATPRPLRAERARALLCSLGLEDRLDHHPADLSGGEQQRVAIARALVKQPDILLADEPTGNLDQENTDSIADLLEQLNRDGLTIIIVTHDQSFSQRVADRIVRLHYGKVVDDARVKRGDAE